MMLMNSAMMGAAGYQVSIGSSGFRYLRITVLTNFGATYMQLNQAELLDSAGSAIPAVSATQPALINGSCNWNSGRWIVSSSDLPVAADIDYGQIVYGESIYLCSNEPQRSPNDIVISLSSDNSTWVDAYIGVTHLNITDDQTIDLV